MSQMNTLSRRAVLKGASGMAAAGALGVPLVGRAQSNAIVVGHLTPRTGFLGPLGELGVMAADLAVEHVNAEGGIMGRKLQLIKEDSVNPQTASTKAERLIERDKVAAIVGEISSASCLTIAQVAQRTKNLFVNTGGNSDALRGANCNRYMFHVESQNSMYVKTCGQSLLSQGGEGKEMVFADGGLRVRPRPVAGGQALHGGQRRQLRGRTAWRRPMRPTSPRCCWRSAARNRTWSSPTSPAIRSPTS